MVIIDLVVNLPRGGRAVNNSFVASHLFRENVVFRLMRLERLKRSAFRRPEGFNYFTKWVPIAILIGVVSGIGALVFYWTLTFSTNLMLGNGAGFYPPSSVGEGGAELVLSPTPYLIPVITTLGGLLSGLIVYRFAPEAEGHGTDAAIDAFHNKKGEIRTRVPLVKIIASAFTIGSGGSAGREGPTAQIGAGFGSYIGKVFHLSPRDRRIAVAIGIGAGIGSIFKAPFGGAILSAEILYLADFEMAVLPPALIASTVGYSVFASVTGWTPIFGAASNQYTYQHPLNLTLFALLGVACGLMAIAYVRSFYAINSFFKRIRVSRYVKPAIGGFFVGVIGIFLPQILGMGYGWLQFAIDGDFGQLTLGIVLLLVVAKILATSLSVGSGGSGGVFAPALFIGGMIGAAMYLVLNSFIPDLGIGPAPLVIVGMMAFFGGAGKVPIAVILMVGEMTGSYTLLVPAMIATTIAYLIAGKNTIYRSQVPSRADSPAHRGEFVVVPLLETLRVSDAMTKDVVTVGVDVTLDDAANLMTTKRINGIPVLDSVGNLVGIVTRSDILQAALGDRHTRTVGEIMTRDLIVAYPDEDLHVALHRMIGRQVGRLPVVDPAHNRTLLGIVAREDIGRLYEEETHSWADKH